MTPDEKAAALLDRWVEERGVSGDWRDLTARIASALREWGAGKLEEAADNRQLGIPNYARRILRARAAAEREP